MRAASAATAPRSATWWISARSKTTSAHPSARPVAAASPCWKETPGSCPWLSRAASRIGALESTPVTVAAPRSCQARR
jgi:hypothetical protein